MREGKTLQEIGDAIGRHKSTISRELQRDTVSQRKSDLTEFKAYFPETGQSVYERNRANCGTKFKMAQVSDFVHFAVEKMLKVKWSPDAICGYAKTNQLFHGSMVSQRLYTITSIWERSL